MNLKNNTSGMTLVEVVVSIALFSLGAILLVSGFGAAGGLFRNGIHLKNSGQRVGAVVEGASAAAGEEPVLSQEAGSFSFLVDGETIEITVNYEVLQDIKDPKVEFKTFRTVPAA